MMGKSFRRLNFWRNPRRSRYVAFCFALDRDSQIETRPAQPGRQPRNGGLLDAHSISERLLGNALGGEVFGEGHHDRNIRDMYILVKYEYT